jgi:hypothetical protein
MSDKPSEHNTLEWDARDQPPTEEQRKKLVRDTLRYASLFPPGPEQSQLRRIARSLTFFEECLHSDEDFANNPRFSLRPSVVGGPDRVVGIRLPSALFAAIGRWAKAEGLSRSDAIRIWLERALQGGRIGRH